MQQFYPRMRYLSEKEPLPVTIVFATRGGCAPVPGVNRRSDPKCLDFVEQGLKIASGRDVTRIVIGASWFGMINRGDYFDPSDNTLVDLRGVDRKRIFDLFSGAIAKLRGEGKQVYVVLNPPGGKEADPKWIIRSGIRLPSISFLDHQARVGDINSTVITSSIKANAAVIDPANYLCLDSRCPTIDPNGEPIYRDPTHLRASYVRERVRFLDSLVMSSTH